MRIEITGMEGLQSRLNSNTLIAPSIRKAFNKSVALLQRDVQKGMSVDTGRARASINFEVDSATFPKWGKVGSNMSIDNGGYIEALEWGSKPHWPPISALRPWAQRHGFPEGDAGAFMVARSIARHGTKGIHMFRNALDQDKDKVLGFFKDALSDIRKRWDS